MAFEDNVYPLQGTNFMSQNQEGIATEMGVETAHDFQIRLNKQLMTATAVEKLDDVVNVIYLFCGQEVYKTPLSRVIGVVPLFVLHSIVGMPNWHLGIVEWQGHVVGVIEPIAWLRAKNGMAPSTLAQMDLPSDVRKQLSSERLRQDRIVIVKDAYDYYVGLKVNDIYGPIKLPVNQLESNTGLLPYFLNADQWWMDCYQKGAQT